MDRNQLASIETMTIAQIKETFSTLLPDKGWKSLKKADMISFIRKHLKEDADEDVDNVVNDDDDSIDVVGVSLKPLVKWSGGKGDEIKDFRIHIPAFGGYYIEPFVGGGSLFFHLSPQKAVINDLHTELIAFYQAIKDGKAKEIHDFMSATPNEEETYYQMRNEMPITEPLDLAKRFYYQRKTCFRGMMRYNQSGKFNVPFGRYKTMNFSELLDKRYTDLLGRTEISCVSFENVFLKYNDPENFVFLDPPYDSTFTDYGYCKFGKEEHIKLAECFKRTKNKCLMIIGETDFIKELYQEYIVGSYEKKYKFRLLQGRVGEEINTKHLIIRNY